jgi:methionyl-tRNA formyltransferase
MKIALIGSVSSSWYALDALLRANVDIAAVVGLDESRATTVSDYHTLRHLATETQTPFQPFIKITEPTVEHTLRESAPDILFVIGLSQLIPDPLINIATQGGVGFHPTMLPEGRGRAPVAWTILKNARAAVSLFQLTPDPDAGDIIAQRQVEVRPHDYAEDLIHRTNLVLAETITDLAPAIKSGTLTRTPQDHAKATFYEMRTPADGRIDLAAPTDQIYRLIRAAGRPYPGAFTHHNKRKLIIWRAKLANADLRDPDAQPGQITAGAAAGHPLMQLTDGALYITESQYEDAPDQPPKLEPGTQLG